MNQIYTGRAKYRSNVVEPTGELLVAVRCRVGVREDEDSALLDTASPWCILPPSIAVDLGYIPDRQGDTRLHTRFGLLSGELVRVPIVFAADEGEPAEVEATWFLSPDWPGPIVIGWTGCPEPGALWAESSPSTPRRATSSSPSIEESCVPRAYPAPPRSATLMTSRPGG